MQLAESANAPACLRPAFDIQSMITVADADPVKVGDVLSSSAFSSAS